MLKPFVLGLALAAAGGGPALAATCAESVERFARAHDLAEAEPEGDRSVVPPTPPVTQESRGVGATDRLAESGGVIKPPDVGETPVIEPPKTLDRMETAPNVAPGPTAKPAVPPSKVELDAAQRAKVESLLTAARAADSAGDSEQCYQRLREAQKIASEGAG